MNPGKTILTYLQELYPDSSKTTLRSWIRQGRVRISGKMVSDARSLVSSPECTLERKGTFLENGLKILYEEKQWVVVDKPANLLSVATTKGTEQNVHAILKKRSNRVYPVHRLDRDVSGVMLFAYTERARNSFKKLFFHHDIQRQYLAVVEGRVSQSRGTWESFLREDSSFYVHSSQNPHLGERSITHFEVLSYAKKTTLLLLTLETGKKNQIRVHCSDAGHPIVGDAKYGSTTKGRILLHAYLLGFSHPLTKKKMEFTSLQFPVDFPQEVFSRLQNERQGVRKSCRNRR